jgi:hypothetical protein
MATGMMLDASVIPVGSSRRESAMDGLQRA